MPASRRREPLLDQRDAEPRGAGLERGARDRDVAVPVGVRPSRRPSARARRASARARCARIASRSTSTRVGRKRRGHAIAPHVATASGIAAATSPASVPSPRAPAGEPPGQAVQVGAGRAASSGHEPAREQPADHAGEHVARARRREHRAAGRVDRALRRRRGHDASGCPSAGRRRRRPRRARGRARGGRPRALARPTPVRRANSPACGVSTASALRSGELRGSPGERVQPVGVDDDRHGRGADQVADEARGLVVGRRGPGRSRARRRRASAPSTGASAAGRRPSRRRSRAAAGTSPR